MLQKVLVANRGEIALRIVRGCADLGIKSVVVYSEADREALPVLIAEEKMCIGPAAASGSYLNFSRVLSVALVKGCDAVHPGYGFLSENADFAEAVIASGLIFVGPKPDTIRLLGDKMMARQRMKAAGVPVVPGSDGALADFRSAIKLAKEIGFPVLLKAAAGGGGKGMRVINDESEMEAGWNLCQGEARASFGDDRLYLEKYITNARHIEVQILADNKGNCVSLGERDCSAQRRHQKLLEESPAPGITAELRQKLGDWAKRAAQAAGYVSAGTVEFICDESGSCYFMEMNARLQVEHPVTEMVTGVDIVGEQLKIAGGERLHIKEQPDWPRGHAIECRIYAEDPDDDFKPSPGLVTDLVFPGGPGVRVDSYIYPGYRVPPFYDPLVAKIVAWGRDREEAVRRMERALAETTIGGIATTIEFHRRLLSSPRFRKGNLTTTLLDDVW
ncbi:MAG: acetyl-CoA carboxylase biotin carboxylase subunit [candidate division WOR-3 bacterium]|jgi:acetyl-CoA carboxylase biotin carboxylase subunit|nr:acetyl-CoA carboxylase biotin carboxylase subunit [candidate division WOR-3 bacterium]MCR4424333.1 acetyl-CoA carboxylase biotin carboxylase subunit [candidate division WOR-3 bacterium]MDH7518151.1 acetyl-CoA carboxylase biotin carboxylase subunit [bacterium]